MNFSQQHNIDSQNYEFNDIVHFPYLWGWKLESAKLVFNIIKKEIQ